MPDEEEKCQTGEDVNSNSKGKNASSVVVGEVFLYKIGCVIFLSWYSFGEDVGDETWYVRAVY